MISQEMLGRVTHFSYVIKKDYIRGVPDNTDVFTIHLATPWWAVFSKRVIVIEYQQACTLSDNQNYPGGGATYSLSRSNSSVAFEQMLIEYLSKKPKKPQGPATIHRIK